MRTARCDLQIWSLPLQFIHEERLVRPSHLQTVDGGVDVVASCRSEVQANRVRFVLKLVRVMHEVCAK